MGRWIKLALAAAMMLCLARGATAAEPIKFGVAAEPYPPFSVKQPTGEWSGFEIDLVHALCVEMKAQCSIVEIAWDGIIPGLLARKIDVIFSSMTITDERQKTIAFTRPYYDTAVAVAAPKSEPIDIAAGGLKGKTIGVQISTVSADYLRKFYDQDATIRLYDTQDAVNADLVAGRIDAMMADAIAIQDFLQTPDAADLENKGGVPYDSVLGRGVGAGLRREDTTLKEGLDKAIGAILQNGVYAGIEKKYFTISVEPRS